MYLTQERQIEIDEFLRSFADGATSKSKSLVVPVGIVKSDCGAGSGEGGGFGPGNTCASGGGSSKQSGNAQILSWAKERFGDDEKAKNFVEWFGDSKAVDADGNPLEMFHGSGNVDGFHEFKPEFTGKGNDQIGSGYYLTNDIKDAGRYTDDTQGSGIVMAFVSVQNPIDTDGDLTLDFTKEQLAGILKKAPGIYDVDESSMGDWHDIWSEGGVQDWMIEDVAEKIMTSDLNALENDFFPEDSGLFRQLVHEATGYDGVVKRFDDGTVHFSAWFPNQIKASVGNEGKFDPNSNDIRKSDDGTKCPLALPVGIMKANDGCGAGSGEGGGFGPGNTCASSGGGKEGGQSVSGFYFNGELRNETVSIKPDAVVVDVRDIDTAESASGGFIANEMFDDMEERYGWDDHSWQVRGVDPEAVAVDSTYVGNLANDHEFGEYLKDKHGVDVIRSGDKNAILNGDVIDDDNFERVTKRDVNAEVMKAIQETTHLAQDILPKLKEFDTNAEKLEFVRGLLKDDPWLKAECPAGFVGNIHDKIVETLNESGINGNHKNKNHTAMMAAVGTFSENGQREIAMQLQDVKWFGNPKQLTQHFQQNPREDLIAGAWHDGQNRLYLDGDNPVIKHEGEVVNAPQFQGVYAHELGHVVDGGTSESKAWKEAWESEMNDSQLTNYAASQPAEGYAELVRVWSTGEKREELEKQFPKSVAILKSQGVF